MLTRPLTAACLEALVDTLGFQGEPRFFVVGKLVRIIASPSKIAYKLPVYLTFLNGFVRKTHQAALD
jgi:hypothetical protein